MVLYSEAAWGSYGITEQQLLTTIAEAFQTSDAAMVNSEINLEFNLVHVGQVSGAVEQARPYGTRWWRFCVSEGMHVDDVVL